MKLPNDLSSLWDRLTRSEKAALVPPAQFWDFYQQRPHGSELPVIVRYPRTPTESQGSRNTCVCFATAWAIELCFLRRYSQRILLSKQYANWLFMADDNRGWCDETLRLVDGIRILATRGICLDVDCSYPASRDVCLKLPIDRPSAEAVSRAIFGVSKYTVIDKLGFNGPSICNVKYLEFILVQGFDIVLTFDRARHDKRVLEETGIWDVIYRESGFPEPPESSHAVLIVGYDRSGNVPYFICKDSRGEFGAPVEGYTRLSYDYLRTYASYGVVVLDVSDSMPTT